MRERGGRIAVAHHLSLRHQLHISVFLWIAIQDERDVATAPIAGTGS